MSSTSPIVSVLDADPDIRQHLPLADLAAAQRAATARVMTVAAGQWRIDGRSDRYRGFGLLLLDGLMARSVTLLGRTSIELIGPEDLILPWHDLSDTFSVSLETTWEVLDRVRFAVLDEQFAERVARWPMIAAALVARSVRRAQWLAFQTAMLENPRLAVRLLLLFWHLADRWGRAAPEGTVVPLSLTHKLLGRIVRAQRPSVTAALRQLDRLGMLARRDDGRWLLRGDADEQLRLLSEGQLCGPG